MVLSNAKAGVELTILSCDATGKARARLDSLGLVAGTRVDVLSSSYAGLIIAIKGSRLALSKAIAGALTVSEE